MLEIDIHQLDQGVHEFLLEPSPEDVHLEASEFSDVRVAARVDFNPRRVFVELEVSAVAMLVCDRSLVSYRQPVSGSFSVLFADASVAEPNSDLDDLQPLDPDARSVDITEAVRDTLLLALPLRRVAPAAEDLDLPLTFGASEDSIDPRWESLRGLKDQGDSK